MASPKTIGLPSTLFCSPYIEGLQGEKAFAVVLDRMATLARRLEARTLSAAFVSPIDYARNASELLIVPGTAATSREGNGSLVVHFRPGSPTVKTLAVPETSASDIILAKILLAERFDLDLTLVPVLGSLDEMLKKADAALLAGDAALRQGSALPGAIDLIEEWVLTTDLPYVHGFWAGREEALTIDDCNTIVAAGARGYDTLSRAGGDSAEFLDGFSLDLSEETREGISEFLRYAFYHGILPDVPELRFYGDQSDSSSAAGLN